MARRDPGSAATAIDVELVSYANPAKLTAIDSKGIVTWQQTTTAPNKQAQKFHIVPTLTADPIVQVNIVSPSNEVLLLVVCLP